MATQAHRVTGSKNSEHLDVLWGAEEIGAFLRKDRHWTYRQIKKGAIPVTRIAGQFMSSRAALASYFAKKHNVMA